MFALVALLAEALQLAQAKLIPVAAVIHDVVGDGRRHDKAALIAETAERLDPQLMLSHILPALKTVPSLAPISGCGVRELGGHSGSPYCSGGSRSVSRRLSSHVS